MSRQTGRENGKVRIILVYRMLQMGKRMTSAQIIEELQRRHGILVDRKTIYNDIAAIDRVTPIKVRSGRGGGYSLWDVVGECEEAPEL